MRVDFYTQVHKKQRNELFLLSAQMSENDFTNSSSLIEISASLSKLIKGLREHAFHEETFIHPLLAKKIPHSERVLHHEHHELHKYLDELENTWGYLQTLVPHYPKSQQQGLEFYRLFNRFIANYLSHINEEEYVLQNLWEVAVDAELMGMMTAFQTYVDIENGEKWLITHLPKMSIDEQLLLFKTANLLAPAHLFEAMRQLAEKNLSTKQWQQIVSQLG